ncbi:hypothetical protein ADK41_23645 [Streptomyces caelestis]|uniref:Uncharacterized protein n=1 Tax=Streptomyces caelestis TaxID=36816 RepID=A0A0M8QH02_9ACTN|nr:hypothetical protein ADK41_23645 [Streptomyces caelestis]KOV32870.1 hypothetical protein ADK58_05895 [Streptomyces sp. XY152]
MPDLKRVTEVWDTAEHRLAQGDVAFVADLGIALADRYGSSAARIWQYRSVFDRLLRLLTMAPGPGHAEQAVRLVSAASPDNRKLVRYAASLLAEGQTPHDLTFVFAGGSSRAAASEELRACLVHEMVLRGVMIAESPAIEAWATSPHWRHHPLAWMPLELSVIEEKPPLPSYSVGGGSYSMPYGPQDGPGVTLGSVTHLPQVTDTTTEEFSEAAAAAVANWTEESNGRSEAGMYDLAEPVEPEGLPDLLVTLGLECLSRVSPRKRLALSSCRAEHAWRMLFAAASTGGAYNNGEYGAYGRLAAWRSVAALSGVPTAAPVSEVEENAQACGWYSFGAATKWFERVAWDIGLVSVAPGARRMAVLAATDTD